MWCANRLWFRLDHYAVHWSKSGYPTSLFQMLPKSVQLPEKKKGESMSKITIRIKHIVLVMLFLYFVFVSWLMFTKTYSDLVFLFYFFGCVSTISLITIFGSQTKILEI